MIKTSERPADVMFGVLGVVLLVLAARSLVIAGNGGGGACFVWFAGSMFGLVCLAVGWGALDGLRRSAPDSTAKRIPERWWPTLGGYMPGYPGDGGRSAADAEWDTPPTPPMTDGPPYSGRGVFYSSIQKPQLAAALGNLTTAAREAFSPNDIARLWQLGEIDEEKLERFSQAVNEARGLLGQIEGGE